MHRCAHAELHCGVGAGYRQTCGVGAAGRVGHRCQFTQCGLVGLVGHRIQRDDKASGFANRADGALGHIDDQLFFTQLRYARHALAGGYHAARVGINCHHDAIPVGPQCLKVAAILGVGELRFGGI